MTRRTFDLDLTPVRDGADWTGIDVSYRADVPSVPAGDGLLALPRVVASIPGAPYATADLRVSDTAGPLTLTEIDGPDGPMMTGRIWVADRDTVGAITLDVHAPVREIDVRTPVGPLFDLRREPLGLFGAGFTILPLPLTGDADEFDFTLTWHLEPGVSAVSSRGTGDVPRRWSGPVSDLQRCLFGAGTPIVEPQGDERFGIHAYSEVPFDLVEISAYLRELHVVMTRFFEEPDGHYQVLVRRNPDKGSGGTSFPSSFAFGYSPTVPVDPQELRSLLAHEMVHNWPTLAEGWEEASWYSEGSAEFYSLVLPWRAGVLSADSLARQLSDMYRRYDTNPLRSLSFGACADVFWADPRAQTMPYGRGVRYLVDVDTRLRESSDGRTSLDDIVLDILRAQRGGSTVTIEGWLDRIAAHLGDRVRDEYRSMIDGAPVPWPSAPFQGAFAPAVVDAVEHDLGFDVSSFHGEPRTVGGVVDGGPAAEGGLRDGDELVSRKFDFSKGVDGTTPLSLVVRRDGREQSITYVPAGVSVPTIEWTPIR